MLDKKILEKPKVIENPFTVYDTDNVQWFDMLDDDPDPFHCDPPGHQVTPHEDVWSDYLLRLWDEEDMINAVVAKVLLDLDPLLERVVRDDDSLVGMTNLTIEEKLSEAERRIYQNSLMQMGNFTVEEELSEITVEELPSNWNVSSGDTRDPLPSEPMEAQASIEIASNQMKGYASPPGGVTSDVKEDRELTLIQHAPRAPTSKIPEEGFNSILKTPWSPAGAVVILDLLLSFPWDRGEVGRLPTDDEKLTSGSHAVLQTYVPWDRGKAGRPPTGDLKLILQTHFPFDRGKGESPLRKIRKMNFSC